MKKVFEPVTDIVEDVSKDITKTMTEISEKNKTLAKLNDKPLKTMKDRGIKASYLLSLLSKITKPEHTSQLKLVKNPDSNRVNDLLMKKTIPVTQ